MNNSDLVIRIVSVIASDKVVHAGFVFCLIITAIIALAMIWGIVRGFWVSMFSPLKKASKLPQNIQ